LSVNEFETNIKRRNEKRAKEKEEEENEKRKKDIYRMIRGGRRRIRMKT
jgi:hypothetical protein